ncbi:MAG TPA: alginate lyase family protein [bacterium]
MQKWRRSVAAIMVISLHCCCGKTSDFFGEVKSIEKARIVEQANRYLSEEPITVTAATCERSTGGLHDYYSEGDYWWPDPENPGGPYTRRDGMSNPEVFSDHRLFMRRLSQMVPALAAAYVITNDRRYSDRAIRHLIAWFVNEDTRMNPNLLYAQAIHGRVTGRGIGIIDTIHLVEVARSVSVLETLTDHYDEDISRIKRWFADYLEWMTTHDYGIEERDTKNNHATCWVMQAAEFARLTGNTEVFENCRKRYKTVLLPSQMAEDGSFPLELERTKPYGYSLFNLDAMATLCQILSTSAENLWSFELQDGRGMRKALAFMYPYILDQGSWPYPADVMYHDQWPVRHPSLLFGGTAFSEPKYVELWKTLDPDPREEEIIRNYPIRQPVLWLVELETLGSAD